MRIVRSSWQTGVTGVGYDLASTYDNLIEIDVQNEMRGINGSVFIRAPFEVTDLESIRILIARADEEFETMELLGGEFAKF